MDKIFFNNIQSAVLNNGFTTNYFNPGRGIRQGCPASPLLFISVVEIMALQIRQNDKINGIQIGEADIKISQLADDTTCFTSNRHSMYTLLDEIGVFPRYAGLYLNYEKSELLAINHEDLTHFENSSKIKVVKKTKILGVHFLATPDEEKYYKLNFAPLLESIRRVGQSWSYRALNLKGKITVLNTLLLSKTAYIVGVNFSSERFQEEIKSLIREFLWNSKSAKIAYKTLTQSIDNGGLRLADIDYRVKASRLMWIRRICNENSNVSKIFKYFAGWNHETLKFFEVRSKTRVLKINCSNFYRELMHVWRETFCTKIHNTGFSLEAGYFFIEENLF